MEAIAIVVHVVIVIGEACLVEVEGGAIDPMEEGEMVLAEMEGEAELAVVMEIVIVTETEEGTVGREPQLQPLLQLQLQFHLLHPNQRKIQEFLPLSQMYQVQRVCGEDSHLRQLRRLRQHLSRLQLPQLLLLQLLSHKLQLLSQMNRR